MQNSYWRDAMPASEAAQYLKVTELQILLAAAEGELRCGIMARGWRGMALRWHGVPARHDPVLCEIRHDLLSEKPVHVYRVTDRNANGNILATYEVEECFAGQFWYLDHSHVYELAIEKPVGIDINWLIAPKPNQAEMHAAAPAKWPEPPFLFVANNEQDRRVSLADLLFLRADLDQLRTAAVPKAEPAPRQNKIDRERCRAVAAVLWLQNPARTIAEMIALDDLTSTACEGREYSPETLRGWIADLCPDRSPGRRPRT